MTGRSLPRDRWAIRSALLDEALAMTDAERNVWLDAQTTHDPDVGAWLRRVLNRAKVANAPKFLDRPRRDHAVDADAHAGALVGSYRLVREIGNGGMGVVWLAHRADGHLERLVALKLPHAHLLAGAVRERFARERTILARLNHPHIATLYDAGLASNGRPFLALEYVDGVPITRWCKEHRSSIDARLDLMRQVMHSVAYAHTQLVVHRDLKPTNVLVTAAGQVKLLDFGIAKMLAPEDGAEEGYTLTRVGHRMATPGYAAPEQVAGIAVTTRADVYALGIMLYELLCGRRPTAMANADSATVEASRCSTQVDPAFAVTVGGSDVASLRRALRGDLDAILAKAINPAPECRYGSVDAFAADLERHRAHEPILAQRAGRMSLAAKFVRRHRLGTGLATALVLAVGAGVALVASEANEAAQQARRALAARDFIIDVFNGSDPRIASDKPRGDITARELLDLGATRVERGFADDPRTQIDLLGTVAAIYRELGVVDRSAVLEARKVQLAQKTLGELSDPVLDSAVQAADWACGDQSESCAELQSTAGALLDRAGRNQSALRAAWWVTEGQRLRPIAGKDAERRAALEKGVGLYRAVAPFDPGYVTAIEELASDHEAATDYSGAIAMHQEALRVGTSLPRRNDAEMQTIYGNIAVAYQQSGEFLKAIAMYDQAEAIAQRTTGPDFIISLVLRSDAANAWHHLGERERADATFEALIPLLPSPERHVIEASDIRETYATRLAAEGRPALALPLLQMAELDYVSHARDAFDLRRVRLRLGDVLDRLGRTADAQAMFSKSLDDYIAHAKPDQQAMLAARERVGRFLLDHGNVSDASLQFDEIVRQAHERKLVHIALAHGDLARVALEHHDTETALRESESALDLWQRREGFFDVRMGPYLERVRADVLARAARLAEAQQLEDQAWAASEKFDAPESSTRVHRKLGRGS